MHWCTATCTLGTSIPNGGGRTGNAQCFGKTTHIASSEQSGSKFCRPPCHCQGSERCIDYTCCCLRPYQDQALKVNFQQTCGALDVVFSIAQKWPSWSCGWTPHSQSTVQATRATFYLCSYALNGHPPQDILTPAPISKRLFDIEWQIRHLEN